MDGAEIPLIDLALLDLFVDDTQCLRCFCRDDDTAGIAVDAVAQRGREGMLLGGTVFALLVEIRLDVIDERVDILAVVGMDDQTRFFVAEDDIVVLIDDIELRGQTLLRIVGGDGFKKFFLDKQLDRIALQQNLLLLGTFAVDLDLFEPDIFVHERGRHGLEVFG